MTRKFEGTELVIATHNRGKLDEIRQMFRGMDIALTCAADHGLPSPEETGTTFLENATLKAVAVARAANRPALADDSGLCVAALGGDPGVYTADWAEAVPGGPRDFDAAMQKVHNKIGANPDRSASFVCCLVLAWPDGHTESVEGRVNGNIIWPPRGDKGHGYDPIFVPDGQNLTCAEMEPERKNSISHRANAFRLMREKCF